MGPTLYMLSLYFFSVYVNLLQTCKKKWCKPGHHFMSGHSIHSVTVQWSVLLDDPLAFGYRKPFWNACVTGRMRAGSAHADLQTSLTSDRTGSTGSVEAWAGVGAGVLDSTYIPWFNNMGLSPKPSLNEEETEDFCDKTHDKKTCVSWVVPPIRCFLTIVKHLISHKCNILS